MDLGGGEWVPSMRATPDVLLAVSFDAIVVNCGLKQLVVLPGSVKESESERVQIGVSLREAVIMLRRSSDEAEAGRKLRKA